MKLDTRLWCKYTSYFRISFAIFHQGSKHDSWYIKLAQLITVIELLLYAYPNSWEYMF